MFDNAGLLKVIFGRLTLEALPFHEPILVVTFVAVALGGAAVVGAITYYRLWGYLWREWFTSVDHKRIGVMYIVLGLVMLLRGFSDALMMRAAASDRIQRLGRILAGSPLRSDFHGPRRHHDLLRGDAACYGVDELCRAAADRCARRRLPVSQ